MSSAAQLAANAANAQHSTGPRTPEGKERSSQNATRHGLTSTRLIVQDDEREEFEELQSSLREEVRPEGALEQDVFTQLVHASWNLRRSRRLEAEQFVGGVDPLTDPNREKQMDRLARYQARIERSYYRALKELRALQTNRMIRITYEQQGKLRGEAPGLVTWGEVSKRTHRNLGQDLIRYIEWESKTLAARSHAKKQAKVQTNPPPAAQSSAAR
jgi:hypothetical protein